MCKQVVNYIGPELGLSWAAWEGGDIRFGAATNVKRCGFLHLGISDNYENYLQIIKDEYML